MIKNMPITLIQNPALQDPASLIWMYAPWSWTLGLVTPFVVAGGAQDYPFTLPADFLRFERGWLQDTDKQQDLQAVCLQPVSTLVSQPVYFSGQSVSAVDKIRFNAIVPPVGSGSSGSVSFYAVYKKIAPDLSITYNDPGALGMPDTYFWVYREAVLYYALKYSDDQRAGSCTSVIDKEGNMQVQYSGQMGVMYAALDLMRKTENLPATYPWSGSKPMTAVDK